MSAATVRNAVMHGDVKTLKAWLGAGAQATVPSLSAQQKSTPLTPLHQVGEEYTKHSCASFWKDGEHKHMNSPRFRRLTSASAVATHLFCAYVQK
eukprot:5480067-Amphidinium_carterae.1